MSLLLFLIFSSFVILGLSISLLLIIRPFLALEIQRKFYEKINWRIEPISVEKERRNTRIMGFILIVLLLAALIVNFSSAIH
ncbi:MAG: hypothetical protein ABIA66_04430 [Candidatus Omnitrophota bacterium]